ncbi:MAG: membrane protein insertase YidC [Polyangiaceae bacterium]
MERGSLLKWAFLGLAIFLFITQGLPLIRGGTPKRQPLGARDDTAAEQRAEAQTCRIDGTRFTAELSTQGGSLRSLRFTDEKYREYRNAKVIEKLPAGRGTAIELVSTTREGRSPLRTSLRVPSAATGAPGTPGDKQQVAFDDLDWKLDAQDGKSCTFVYKDDRTELTKVVAANERPFELDITLTVTNKAAEPLKHRLAMEQTSWRTVHEMDSSLGMQSELITKAVSGVPGDHFTHDPGSFDPDDFAGEKFTAEKWLRDGPARYAGVSNAYFAQLVVPIDGPGKPFAETQVEEYWDATRYPDKKDPQHGYVFRGRLAYPELELAPGASATYKAMAFTGPKERDVLAHAGAQNHGLSDVIELGWFGVIGKVLVAYIYWLHRVVGSWGWAICLLTISVKFLLFPLSIAQIKSTAGMRRLKPEMDAINAKYKDDATQRGLATQELWRKNGVTNPFLGCIPVMLQMPVWFALYSALQTAVELYHTPFGPFIPDLSSPGKYFIIPIILGASSFLQQKIMPPQGDPAQQKMMMYMMPGIFTVMMLFLPAGLGVYMLTNTWLGILQQVSVEKYLKAKTGGVIVVKEKQGPSDTGGSEPKASTSSATTSPSTKRGEALRSAALLDPKKSATARD